MGKSLKINDQPPNENSTSSSNSSSATTVDNVQADKQLDNATEKKSSYHEKMGDTFENFLNQPPPPTPAPRGVQTRRTGAMAEQHENQVSPREIGATSNNGNRSVYYDGNGTLAGNVVFYDQTFAAHFGDSNKTFNASDFNNTTTNNGYHQYGQAETTLGQAFGVGLGSPHPDTFAPNATFLGRTLYNNQEHQQGTKPEAHQLTSCQTGSASADGAQIPVQILTTAGYSSSMESHAQGQNYLTIGNGAGPFSMYRGNSNSDETPKTSRKRKRHNLITNKTPPLQQQNFKQDQSLDQLIQPFISMVTNPDLPYGAKMGCVTSIEAVLNENRVNPTVLRAAMVNPVKSLVQEDFLNELGKLLEIAFGNPSISSHVQTVLKVLDIVSSLSPEAKTLVQTCCFGPLSKLGNQIDVVNKANEILGQLKS